MPIERQALISRLLEKGLNISQISRETGFDRKTVRTYAKKIKPNIDLDVELEKDEDNSETIELYTQLGYIYAGELIEGETKRVLFARKK